MLCRQWNKEEPEDEVKVKGNMEEDDKATQDNELETTTPAPSSRSASIENDPKLTGLNRLFTTEQEKDIIHWVAWHPVLYYFYFDLKVSGIQPLSEPLSRNCLHGQRRTDLGPLLLLEAYYFERAKCQSQVPHLPNLPIQITIKA